MKFTISGVRKAAIGILKTYRPNLERRKRTISFLIFFFTIETFEKEKLHYKYREKVFFVFFFLFFFRKQFQLDSRCLRLGKSGMSFEAIGAGETRCEDDESLIDRLIDLLLNFPTAWPIPR